MPQLNEREALEMKIKNLIKEICTDNNYPFNDFTLIKLQNNHFVKIIKKNSNSILIHTSEFDNYFNDKNIDRKQHVKEHIRNILQIP